MPTLALLPLLITAGVVALVPLWPRVRCSRLDTPPVLAVAVPAALP